MTEVYVNAIPQNRLLLLKVTTNGGMACTDVFGTWRLDCKSTWCSYMRNGCFILCLLFSTFSALLVVEYRMRDDQVGV